MTTSTGRTAGLPFSALQIVAGCAVVITLLGAAYAVGRSQGPAASLPTEAAAEATAPATPAAAAAPTPKPMAKAAPAPATPAAASPAKAAPAAAACAECGTVTAVRSERRQGEPTGIGAVGGAVVGGILGHQIGGGVGKQIATVGGAVAGGYAGNQIEKHQRSHTVWVVEVRMADGNPRRFERSVQPDVRAGDEIVLTDQGFVRR